MHLPLAAIYWDPDPTIFTLPYVDHPIRWYGLLFALGFLVGYMILVRIFRDRLMEYPQLTSDQVLDWKAFARELCEQKKSETMALVLEKLDRSSRKRLSALKDGEMPDAELQQAMLKAVNEAMLIGGESCRHRRRDRIDLLLRSAILSITGVAYRLGDRLAIFVVAGTVIGARLGHVFFYEWPRYQNDLLGIVKVWEGGLASHGGAIGVILAIIAFRWTVRPYYPWLNTVCILDSVVIPTGFVGCCIRLGNFVNQEILGRVSDLPWAVVFGRPIDGSVPIARHPVQMYEAIAYLGIFVILSIVWKRCKAQLHVGVLTGWFFILTFGARFFLEFYKEVQSQVLNENSVLLMGQWLSLPFILLGVSLLLVAGKWRDRNRLVTLS